jgi:hypothetical protein
MINNIKNLNKEELLNWLRNEAGVNDPSWFGENLFVGGLEIQQIPEEYINYLWFLKTNKFKNYLNIGIGKGGSFLVETFIQENLESSTAVDNSSYWHQNQKQSITEKIEWLENNTSISVKFYDTDSKEWLKQCDKKFDIIFIDGDHSYEGVKEDYINSLPLLEDNGYLIFHDIVSIGCPGVVQLWDEIKHSECLEFVNKNTCGIGIWKKI